MSALRQARLTKRYRRIADADFLRHKRWTMNFTSSSCRKNPPDTQAAAAHKRDIWADA
jgi:hypothetical protein